MGRGSVFWGWFEWEGIGRGLGDLIDGVAREGGLIGRGGWSGVGLCLVVG